VKGWTVGRGRTEEDRYAHRPRNGGGRSNGDLHVMKRI